MRSLADRLRNWTISPTAAPASDLMDEAAAELERLTLTDAERQALADAADRYAEITPESAETAATLRGLLERMK